MRCHAWRLSVATGHAQDLCPLGCKYVSTACIEGILNAVPFTWNLFGTEAEKYFMFTIFTCGLLSLRLDAGGIYGFFMNILFKLNYFLFCTSV